MRLIALKVSSLLVLAIVLLGADIVPEQILRLNNFGGLDTRSGDFAIKPTASRIAHNIDWSNSVGSISRRSGYDSASTISGQDSIIGIYAAYKSNGEQYLVCVTDSQGVGYGNVYVTTGRWDSTSRPSPFPVPGSVSDSWGMIATYWCNQAKPYFAMFNDIVYMVNGRQRGMAYNGDKAVQWPPNGPGECTLIPLSDNGPLVGEYRYVFTYTLQKDGDTVQHKYLGVVSSPVIVDSGQVMIRDFQVPQVDSAFGSIDTAIIHIYRTKANPSPITDADYAYYTGIDVVHDGITISFSTQTIIDSIADDYLSSTDSICLVDENLVGFDSLKVAHRRYGSPGYYSADSTISYDSAGDTASPFGVYYGIPKQVDTLGVVYAVSFVDTITNTQSVLSPGLAVMVDTASQHNAAKPFKYRIGIPYLPDGADAMKRNLYRAHILQITRDSTFTHVGYKWPYLGQHRHGDTVVLVDTVITTPFYFLATIDWDSSAYSDSVRYDSLTIGDIYTNVVPSTKLKNLFTFDNRLCGTDGSRFYFSRADTAGKWGAFDFVSLNKDDGDEITLAYQARGVVRVYKNGSSYNVFQDDNFDWTRTEISKSVGCIAPYSHAVSPLGHYYLSSLGVIRETEGTYLERTANTEILSGALSNFDNMSVGDKADAVGFYHDYKYMICIGDTTYVYDELANAWSTWSFKFSQAVHYNYEKDVMFLPGDTMCFIRPGDTNVYQYGTSASDNGGVIVLKWRSAPILIGDPNMKQLTKVGAYFYTDDNADTMYVSFYDHNSHVLPYISERNDSLFNYIKFYDMTDGYQLKSIIPGTYNNGVYYQVDIVDSTSLSRVSDIDIYWRPIGPVTVE